jgi:dTDP-4-dehydrorhamnose 3,5-epimerase
MQVQPTDIPDVKLLTPMKHGDHRGFFSETYSQPAMLAAGIDKLFVQDNHSLSASAGVVRGLHYQIGKTAQAKLIRVIRGSILDIAVDIRRSSRSFGRHVRAVISADNWTQIYVPEGFAHGFVTLEPNTEVIYKVTAPYSPADERGILWNDPALGIDWGVDESTATLSDRDRKHPRLVDQSDLF